MIVRSFGLPLISRVVVRQRKLLQWMADPTQTYYTLPEVKAATLKKMKAKQERKLSKAKR